jgi:small-conductance mechanosensitive channel
LFEKPSAAGEHVDSLHVELMFDPVVIVFLFAAAWLLARAAGFVALKVLVWNDRRVAETDLTQAGRMRRLKRRETQVSIVRAAVTYLGFVTAAVLAAGQLIGGVDRLTALAGASFLLILVGFAIQRVLMDIIAGLAMFIERWYSVGDTIQIPMHELQGIVEDFSLRHTLLRTLDGEVIHIHNSQIPSVRVMPSGVKELQLEVFVTDRDRGLAMVESVSGILPEGPTTFIRKPQIDRIDELGETLVRISARAAVAPGREWLVDGFFADLLRESAEPGLIAHGPVTLAVDESAARSYSRASAATRRPSEYWPSVSRAL